MAAVWDNELILDLAIPNNGALVEGSGTIYIGGPRMPSELVANGFIAAIVYYSDTVGSVKYHFETAGTKGYVDSGGTLFFTDLNVPPRRQIIGMPDIDMVAVNDVVYRQTGASVLELISLSGMGVKPRIMGLNSTEVDVFLFNNQVGSIGGVALSSINHEWVLSLDRWVHVYVSITCPTPPATLNFTIPSVPTVAPTVQEPIRTLYCPLTADTGAATASAVLPARIVTPFTNITLLAGAANPNNYRRFFVNLSYPIDR